MTARQRRRGRRGRSRPRPEGGEAGRNDRQASGQGQERGREQGRAGQADQGQKQRPRRGQGQGQGQGQRQGKGKGQGQGQGQGRGKDQGQSQGQGKAGGQGRRRSRAGADTRRGRPGRGKGTGEAKGRRSRGGTAAGGRARRARGKAEGEAKSARSSPADRDTASRSRGRAGLGREARPAARETPKPRELESMETIGETLERVLESSPADETELVWLEVSRGEATRRGGRIDVRISPERTVLVRVLDLGRVGSYRTCSGEAGDLSNAVRLAVSQSRVREPLAGLPHLPADSQLAVSNGELHDQAVSSLDARSVRELLEGLPAERETLTLHWADSRVVVYNSRKVRRQAAVTGVGFEARCGRGPGAGRAADAARRLQDLNPESILERARLRHARGDTSELPEPGVPVLLAPEAAISLIEMLNQESFSAKAYYDGTSFLREHLGVQVFDRALNLRDDGTDPAGIPFPFDLEGTAKREVPLILDGAPKTPALDQRQAAVLGLPPTAHAIGGNDARAQNLFLVAGDKSPDELLTAADGGVWIGWLDHLECREPHRVQFRARARGARLIENGALGRPLPDLFWQDSLLRAFSSILGLGSGTARRLTRDGYLGGFSAPAIALGGVEGLQAS